VRLRSIIPLVAAAIMVLSAAVIGARPAAAATSATLCLYYPASINRNLDVCADPNGSSPVAMLHPPGLDVNGYPSAWLYNGLNHTGQIQQTDTSLCMQLDHNAGNTVIEAKCNGASYQKWTAFLAPDGYDWSFYSMWDMNQCLTYNEDHSYLDTVACNGAWYQSFSPND
jgi:hypothetical protein